MVKNLRISFGLPTPILATNILTIDPGSRAIGTAYFEDGELVLSKEIKSSSKFLTCRLDNILTSICENYLTAKPDVIVIEFGGQIRFKGRDPHGIRVHDYAAGYISSGLSAFFQKPLVLIPPTTWKSNKPKNLLTRQISLEFNREIGEDEAHAIALGLWYLRQVKLNQLTVSA
ncbi:MAG: hypothetical protein AMQ22_00219 [Candidatus Methanofastidiosum methylothiophilum]|uniref:Holliday junction resolvase RuvC n=1 Tax=Candidatus Methanofastidiosum methylothiophilum TaxID=1705564 RepID=A0A150J8X4_9EURY|nr:MAG: hypothetical protein APG11_00824 [Candidatus Methanofastidiosum methylthiophilus]KYC53548.1 MAG: hypothetical protein AMQ22_00219 [Candidatus Methanofastidiosum methylthiophilus]